MSPVLRSFRNFFVSLQLTVVLLCLGMILVFVATLDQVNLGIWAVQEKYFRSFFVLGHVGEVPVPVYPGGYLIGGLLLLNLVAAHLYRFRFTWRKAGIFLTHAGLILLLLGELLSGLWQQDYNMRLSEGETKNYAESYRYNELAIADVTDPKVDDVVAIPEERLARGEPIQHPKLPFRVVTKAYFPNSVLTGRAADPKSEGASLATTGIGMNVSVVPQPVTYKQDEQNEPAAFVELDGPEGPINTWLVTTRFRTDRPDLQSIPQHFEYGGRQWKIALRPERAYKPFALTLLKFSHDVYPGTDIPKNFSSRLRLTTADGHDDREVLIYMNNPLRYAGLTFYQSGYDGETTTILQVVRNPSWQLPYFACGMMALGLVVQFGIHLFGFVGKRRRSAAGPVAEQKETLIYANRR